VPYAYYHRLSAGRQRIYRRSDAIESVDLPGLEELHGLYEPGPPGQRARISVWMRTAQRRQVVAFRTFLRTFVHEICHHLDYELYELRESFHTQGFFQRESSLYRQLTDS
jgi:hypothetical protein